MRQPLYALHHHFATCPAEIREEPDHDVARLRDDVSGLANSARYIMPLVYLMIIFLTSGLCPQTLQEIRNILSI